jgi:hypothetical protein
MPPLSTQWRQIDAPLVASVTRRNRGGNCDWSCPSWCRKLEPGALEVKGFKASFRRRRLIEQPLEDPPRDTHRAVVLPEQDGELDRSPLVIPVSVVWEGSTRFSSLDAPAVGTTKTLPFHRRIAIACEESACDRFSAFL